MTTSSEEAKLEIFQQWLQVNGVELRGCEIKYCNARKGFGIFSSDDVADGVLLVVPLDLAITPMRVLLDPLFGPKCRAMLQEGEVDDRLLIMLFLMVERLRGSSLWKPYLDMLPTTFGNPLWFTDDELLELKGTNLHRATELQRNSLKSLFDEKVKNLAEKLLAVDGNQKSGVSFDDFLWANSTFWSRALNIALPSSYVFPDVQPDSGNESNNIHGASVDPAPIGNSVDVENRKTLEMNNSVSQLSGVATTSPEGERIWVEGLVPGIDFCNHHVKPAATWEVDGTGSATGKPFSMYLISGGKVLLQGDKEISISYGDKGNEELLYLYGFVVEDNPDDFLMIHYPMEALSHAPFSETKMQLLEAQKGELRCLCPRNLLKNGFFPKSAFPGDSSCKSTSDQGFSYSWSGQRKMPAYANKLVFPESFLTSLRTVAMKETELYHVSSLLEELVGSGGERQPSASEVRVAVWEACGDSGALQLLVDLLNMKMMELEEGSGMEESDAELLKKAHDDRGLSDNPKSCTNDCRDDWNSMSRNRWASIVYRQGQKQLTRLLLREAEHALQLALSEEGN